MIDFRCILCVKSCQNASKDKFYEQMEKGLKILCITNNHFLIFLKAKQFRNVQL